MCAKVTNQKIPENDRKISKPFNQTVIIVTTKKLGNFQGVLNIELGINRG